MTIPVDKQGKSVSPPMARMPFVERREGDSHSLVLTNQALGMLKDMTNLLNGMTPLIPCNEEFAANTYTLTPTNIAPAFYDYADFLAFAFVATDTSTGNISATVVPSTGSVATLKVYKANGATRAAAGDIVSGSFYILYYVDSLDTGTGGFVIK